MRAKAILAGLFILVVSTDSFAYWLFGKGNQSCGTFVKEHKRVFETNSPSLEDVANFGQTIGWINGFKSGINFARDSNLGSDNDIDAVLQWIRNYCEEHPLNDIADATTELVKELENRQ